MSSRVKELLDDISTINRQMRKMAAEGFHHTNSRAARALRHDLFDARKQLHKLVKGKHKMGSTVTEREGARRRLLSALIDWHSAEHLTTKKAPPHYYDKLEGSDFLIPSPSLYSDQARKEMRSYVRRFMKANNTHPTAYWKSLSYANKRAAAKTAAINDAFSRHSKVGLPVLDTGTKDWKEDPFKMGHNQGVGMLTQEQVNKYNVGRWVPRGNGRGWWQPGGGAYAYGTYFPGGGWHAYPSGRIVHNPMSIRGEVGYMDQFASRNPFKMGYDRTNAFKMGVNELEPFKMGHTELNAFKMGWNWNPGGGRYDGRANWHPGGGWRVQPSGSRRHVRPSYVGDTVFAYGEAAPVAAAFKSHPAWAARRAQQRKKIHRLCTLAAQGNPRARYILNVVRQRAAQGNKRALRILRDCAQFAALNKRPQSQTSGCGLAPMDHASTHSLGAAVMAKLSGI